MAKDGATGAPLAELVERAPALDRIVPTVARLACALRRSLGDATCDPASAERVGLSASVEADHEYAAARDAYQSGRYDEALSRAQKAIAIDPGFVLAHQARGMTLLDLARTDEGRQDLRFALAHKDAVAEREALELSASYHLVMDEFDQASEAYAELLTRWPADTYLRGNLAICYVQMGQVERGVEAARQAAEEHPQVRYAQWNVPLFALIAGRPDEAAAKIRSLFASFPHPAPEAYVTGVVVNVLIGHHDEALDLLAKLKTVSPSVAALLEADAAMFEGRWTDAVAGLEAGIAADERDKTTSYAETKWALLAEAMIRLGQMHRAREAAMRASKSEDIATLLSAARVLARTGKEDEAATLGRIIAAHPGVRTPLFARIVAASVLAARHATKEAIAAAMGEAGTGPGSWVAHADLGAAYFELGAFEDALRELEVAAGSRGAGAFAYYDDLPTLRYLPGVVYLVARSKDALGRPDAPEAYRAFLAMEPYAQGDPLVVDAERRLQRLTHRK